MRKETPDIMSALMGGAIKPESNKESLPASNKAIMDVINKGEHPDQTHFEGMAPPKEADQSVQKEKATFNLARHTLQQLEDAWIEIRKMRRDKKISKTDIVEQAIEDAVRDLSLKGAFSKFYSKLDTNKAIKQ